MTSFKWSILAIVKKKLAAILRNTRYFLQVLFYFDRNPGVAKGLLKKKSNRKKSGLVGNYLWSTRYSGDVVQFHLIFLLETRLRDHLDFTSEQHFWHYHLFPLNIPCIQSNCMAIQLKNNTFYVTLLSYFLFLYCIRFFVGMEANSTRCDFFLCRNFSQLFWMFFILLIDKHFLVSITVTAILFLCLEETIKKLHDCPLTFKASFNAKNLRFLV